MGITEFLKKHNDLVVNDSFKFSILILKQFKQEHPTLFESENDWSLEKHRDKIIDWYSGGGYKNNKKEFLPLYCKRSEIRISKSLDDNNAKNEHTYTIHISLDEKGKIVTPFVDFTKYSGDTYSVRESSLKYHFNEEILFHDYINLKLKNYYDRGIDITKIDKDTINEILEFIKKYGVDFIKHDSAEDCNDYNYFSRFTYIWSEFIAFYELIKLDSTIPYSKSSKKYKDTSLEKIEFQKRIINDFISQAKKTPTSNDKELLKNIYQHYNHPISFLFDYLIKTNTRELIKSCSYCKILFVAKRKDQTACCLKHAKLSKRKRSYKKHNK
ncbi:MAG TPA: hypothetical protein VIK86_08845 [Candidatus Paceibacterota bacterium]